jgi:hypothetical protein
MWGKMFQTTNQYIVYRLLQVMYPFFAIDIPIVETQLTPVRSSKLALRTMARESVNIVASAIHLAMAAVMAASLSGPCQLGCGLHKNMCKILQTFHCPRNLPNRNQRPNITKLFGGEDKFKLNFQTIKQCHAEM